MIACWRGAFIHFAPICARWRGAFATLRQWASLCPVVQRHDLSLSTLLML